MSGKIIEDLKKMEVLEGVGDEALETIAENSRELKLTNGDFVFEEGQENDRNMYFVLSGTAAVVKFMRNNERDVGVLQSGDYFGEFALFTDKPRQAKVEARENTRILELSYALIDSLKQEKPQAVLQLYENMFRQVSKQFAAMAQKAEKTQFWLR